MLSQVDVGTRPPLKELVRFGSFELEPETGELRKSGVRLKMQSKPAQILAVLVSRQGELIRREELVRRLWCDGTFVDFESGLNTAVNRLRAVLGDNPESPRYIETIPRLGYRFICPVENTKVEGPPVDGVFAADRCCASLYTPLAGSLLWRLATATMLAFLCQCLFVYLHLRTAVTMLQACSSK